MKLAFLCGLKRVNNAYRLGSMLDGGQDVEPVQVDAEVGLFGLREDLEDFPTRSSAVNAAVCECFGEDDMDDLEDCVRDNAQIRAGGFEEV